MTFFSFFHTGSGWDNMTWPWIYSHYKTSKIAPSVIWRLLFLISIKWELGIFIFIQRATAAAPGCPRLHLSWKMIHSTSDPGLISPAAEKHINWGSRWFPRHFPIQTKSFWIIGEHIWLFLTPVKTLQNRKSWLCWSQQVACTESCLLDPACYLT